MCRLKSMFVIFSLIFWSRGGCFAVMGSGALAPFSGAASLCSEEELLDLLLRTGNFSLHTRNI
jgi:hypothetical protein